MLPILGIFSYPVYLESDIASKAGNHSHIISTKNSWKVLLKKWK